MIEKLENRGKKCLAIFMRWLKENNLIDLFLYAYHNSPSNVHTLEMWNKRLNAQYLTLSTLVYDSPFEWSDMVEPYYFKSCIQIDGETIDNLTWGKIASKWYSFIKDIAF